MKDCEFPLVLYVTGRIYRPLEVLLRQFVSGLAQAGRPVRVEATQEHVPMLLEAYAAHGLLDRVALYVPALRNRSLASSFHRGAEIDVMLQWAAGGASKGYPGASAVYCGDLTAAEKAMIDVGADADLVVVVASSYTDDWRQIVSGTVLAEDAIEIQTPTYWLTTAKQPPVLEGCARKGEWEALLFRGTPMFAWNTAIPIAPAMEVQHV